MPEKWKLLFAGGVGVGIVGDGFLRRDWGRFFRFHGVFD